ncbi:MAG: CXXX repeat peptide maturase [Bacteroidales bacterium]|nr:CXXX repeat peptide maturase [Bacteroidales bacterium]
MLKYLIVQLDDSAPSFCHYPDSERSPRLIPLEILRDALLWSMKENLTVQFIYPDYELPKEYAALIDTVYHADIVSASSESKNLLAGADVVVLNSLDNLENFTFAEGKAYVWRTSISEFLKNHGKLFVILPRIDRLNVVFTDIANFKDSLKDDYSKALDNLAEVIASEYQRQHPVQVNLLTDRILLEEMNNCNAGDECITLCPDGRYYICPAFYSDSENAVGDINNGPDVKNPQLYRLDHAPICRTCDAWQCRRCVWMNRDLTLEVNTPGRQQCVMAHLERNASARLLKNLCNKKILGRTNVINESDCLDPYEKLIY